MQESECLFPCSPNGYQNRLAQWPHLAIVDLNTSICNVTIAREQMGRYAVEVRKLALEIVGSGEGSAEPYT